MDALPEAADPLFAEKIRDIMKVEALGPSGLMSILEDPTQSHMQRFASLYALLQELNREERDEEYMALVSRYEYEFGGEPYFRTFLAVVALGDGTSESGARRALAHSNRAIAALPDRPGVLHQHAAICAALFDISARPNSREADRALELLDRAITLSARDNPNFHRTRARLLRHMGRLEESLLEINFAIRRQGASTPSEVRQLAQFEAFRTRVYFDVSGRELRASIDAARRELNAAKGEQVQLLGVLAAVIALITTTVAIATRVEASLALRFVVTASGTVTLAFATLIWTGSGKHSWWRLMPGVLIGGGMIVTGLLSEVKFT